VSVERLNAGDRIRNMEVNYREGVVTRIDGTMVSVRFDDGGEETRPAGFYERLRPMAVA